MSAESPAPVPPAAVGWTDSGLIAAEHILPLVSGAASEGHWLLDLFSTLPISRQGAWLSLHCGGGGLEFLATQRALFSTLDGFDPSPEAIAAARAWVQFHGVGGVEFAVGSVPDLPLAEGVYDLVLSQYSLHRLPDPDAFFARLDAALRPGGWLILNEYVGPKYFQCNARQLRIVEELLAILPPRLRVHWPSGGQKTLHIPPPVAHFLENAPLEAVSSEELVAAVERRFDLESRRDYGGTILNPLLAGIIGNFDPAREDDLAILRLLALSERLLLREASLPSDFAVLVARKRAAG
ncbi:MAG: class I SAM-dependent methyltransferase [Thermoanaerobaculia bacterium]